MIEPKDKAAAYVAFKAAVQALSKCWDNLYHLESQLDEHEINIDDISSFAGDDDWSLEAFDEFLNSLDTPDDH